MVRANSTKSTQGWTVEKDILICRSWQKHIVTPLFRNNQKFWAKILTELNAKKTTGAARTQTAVETRWYYIEDRMHKFCGALSQISRSFSNGTTANDRYRMATELYPIIAHEPFQLGHCWDILQTDVKFQVMVDPLMMSRPRPSGRNTYTANLVPRAFGGGAKPAAKTTAATGRTTTTKTKKTTAKKAPVTSKAAKVAPKPVEEPKEILLLPKKRSIDQITQANQTQAAIDDKKRPKTVGKAVEPAEKSNKLTSNSDPNIREKMKKAFEDMRAAIPDTHREMLEKLKNYK